MIICPDTWILCLEVKDYFEKQSPTLDDSKNIYSRAYLRWWKTYIFCKIFVLSNFWTSRFMVVFCLQRVPPIFPVEPKAISWLTSAARPSLGGIFSVKMGANGKVFLPQKNGRNWLGQKGGLKNNSRSIGMLAPRTSASPKGALGQWCAFPDGLRCQGSALQLSRWRRNHHRNVLAGCCCQLPALVQVGCHLPLSVYLSIESGSAFVTVIFCCQLPTSTWFLYVL